MTRNRSSSDGEVHLHRVPLDNKLSLSDRDPNKKSIIGRSVGVSSVSWHVNSKALELEVGGAKSLQKF